MRATWGPRIAECTTRSSHAARRALVRRFGDALTKQTSARTPADMPHLAALCNTKWKGPFPSRPGMDSMGSMYATVSSPSFGRDLTPAADTAAGYSAGIEVLAGFELLTVQCACEPVGAPPLLERGVLIYPSSSAAPPPPSVCSPGRHERQVDG